MTPTDVLERPTEVAPPDAPPQDNRTIVEKFADSMARNYKAVRVQMARLWAWIKLKARNGWTRVKQSWTWVKAKVTKLASWVKTKTVEVWTKVKEVARGFWGWLKNKVRTIWNWVKTKVVKVWDWTCTKARQAWDWACAKAPAIAEKVMAGVGWFGARFAQLGVAAKVGVVAVTSTAAAVVASPVFMVLGALAITTMILSSKSKPKVRTVIQPSAKEIERMRARQAELADQLQEANEVSNYKLSSELLGRHMFLEEKIKGNLSKEPAHVIASRLQKQYRDEMALSMSPTAAMVLKDTQWPSFVHGVKDEVAMWADPTLYPATPTLTPVTS